MRQRLKAFTLIELLVVIAIIALLISILLPSLSRARELSKRLVCASNIKGLGTSAKIYANDNNEKWMIPPFKRKAINLEGIDYLNDTSGTPDWPSTADDGEVGNDREFQTTSETPQFPNIGSNALSTTRAYWMLVRSGNITVAQFICPSSGEQSDQTQNLELYYDFMGYTHVSYGYQVPFGPRDTQPREGMDNRQILAADQGPYYIGSGNIEWSIGSTGDDVTLNDSPRAWRRWNSPNHGGRSNGEGQNCLYADGHASFQRKPAAGIDSDNIYTQIDGGNWGSSINAGLIHGFSPHGEPPPYPGQNALGTGVNDFASTDTLIYP